MRDQQLEAIRAACIKANPHLAGTHIFPVGESRCQFCSLPRITRSVDRRLVAEDKTSGGSVHEVSVTETDITGGFCYQNPIRPIRLADVLLATEHAWATMFAAGGGLIDGKPPREVLPEGLRLYQIVRKWNLRKDDLTLQGDGCVAFLYDLLQ